MSEQDPKLPSESGEAPEEPRDSITYASPMKRIWAWVGVVYMLIITLLVTYLLATGEALSGIPGLMLVPALGGIAASTVYLWLAARKERRTPGRQALMLLIAAACVALIALNLIDGIPVLLAKLGG